MTALLAGETGEVYEQIVTEIADREAIDPVELPPLFDAVDPDALESLFAATGDGDGRVGRVWFPYAGYDVTIEYNGEQTFTIERQTDD